MDEILAIKESQFGVSILIPDSDEVYRQVPITQLEEGRFPQPGHFTIKYDRGEKELSTNWSAYTDTLDSYCIIGLSANINGAYKDVSKYKLFSIPVLFLRSILGIEKVVHTPVFHGNPSEIGKPNNYSHASIFFQKENQVEVRKKLSTYCNQHYNTSFKSIDFDLLCPIIDQLKERKENTKYHRCLKG